MLLFTPSFLFYPFNKYLQIYSENFKIIFLRLLSAKKGQVVSLSLMYLAVEQAIPSFLIIDE